jgi:hypothetical protein
MAQSVNSGLYGVERQALEVMRVEYEKYMATQGLTPAFVALMRNTHEMLMKGAKQRAGLDTANKSPREILVELQQLVVEFQMLVDQENEMVNEGTIQ